MMDYMCHLCARCFDTFADLRKHIQTERSQFLNDVDDIFAQSQPSISSVLELLQRYTTHSTELDGEQDLACPEPGCTYTSTESYQALQRHYMKHVQVPADLKKCPACFVQLGRVSLGFRHPGVCTASKMKGLPVITDLTNWKKDLSTLAYKSLRLAQRAKRRQTLVATKYAQRIETGSKDGRGIASVADTDSLMDPVTATTTSACGRVIQRPYNNRQENIEGFLECAPTSSQYPRSHLVTAPKMGAAGGSNREVLNNNTHLTQREINVTSTSTNEAAPYALPDQHTNMVEGPLIHEPNSLLSTSSDFLRAATLGSNTADGAAVYSMPILQSSMTGGMISYDAAPFLNPGTGVLRAATLGSNTADGTAAYPPFSQHQSMAEATPGYDAVPFPTPDVEFLRAATLGNNTADGATTYFSLRQHAFEGTSFGQDDFL